MVEPFAADQLIARMRALQRRTSAPGATIQRIVTAEGLRINLLERSVSRRKLGETATLLAACILSVASA